MFEIKPLAKPETVTVPGGVFTLTHSCTVGAFDPRSKTGAVLLTKTKGFLGPDGEFQDFGDPERSTLDAQGLADMLADTTGGKPPGVFRTTDILPAIAKREAALQAAEDAKAEIEADQADAKPETPKAP